MTKPGSISTPINVRFRDIDSMGHVNNAVYFTYFEEGRKTFVQTLFKLEKPADFQFILAHVSCDYLRPVTLNDRLLLRVWISHIGRKRFDMQYLLTDPEDNDLIYAKGRSSQVFYDYRANRSQPIPDTIRSRLRDYLFETDERNK